MSDSRKHTPNLSDMELVQKIRSGNTQAFEQLFDTWYEPLCRYAMNYVVEHAEAEDLVKDVFCKFWEQRERLNIMISIRGYLYVSVRNICLDHLKRRRLPRVDIPYENVSDPFGGDDSSFEIICSQNEHLLARAIDKLPESCKRIFLMSRRDGMSHREIATALNITEGTVKTQIFRAVHTLVEKLKTEINN